MAQPRCGATRRTGTRQSSRWLTRAARGWRNAPSFSRASPPDSFPKAGRSFEETGPPLPGTRPGRDGGLLLHRSRKLLNHRSFIANRDRGSQARVGSEGELSGSTAAAGRIEDRNLLLAAVRRETGGRKKGISAPFF